jgi:colanic acid biosynthesis glycosyl transferase WcaI
MLVAWQWRGSLERDDRWSRFRHGSYTLDAMLKRDKRILLHDFGAYPFACDLADFWCEQGMEVDFAWCASNSAPNAAGVSPRLANARPISLRRPFSKYGVKRFYSEVAYGVAAFRFIRRGKYSDVISSNCPVISQVFILAASRFTRARFVFWLQDVFGLTALLGKTGVAIRLARPIITRLERRVLRGSDAVVAISDDFARYVRGCGVSAERVCVQPNWAPLYSLSSTADDGHFEFLYAGTLGLKHPWHLLLELAEAVESDGGRVVVVSEGQGVAHLRQSPLPSNVTISPFVELDVLRGMYARASVLVALLEPGASRFSVPSKVAAYLSAGRPVLAAIPAENEAAKMIITSGAGTVASPDDAAGFLEAAQRLMRMSFDDREALGAAGRRFADATFDLASIGERLAKLLT